MLPWNHLFDSHLEWKWPVNKCEKFKPTGTQQPPSNDREGPFWSHSHRLSFKRTVIFTAPQPPQVSNDIFGSCMEGQWTPAVLNVTQKSSYESPLIYEWIFMPKIYSPWGCLSVHLFNSHAFAKRLHSVFIRNVFPLTAERIFLYNLNAPALGSLWVPRFSGSQPKMNWIF